VEEAAKTKRGPLEGVHFLLTYKCIFECDHCFVWGSPSASGTFSSRRIEDVLKQASEIPTVKRVYFEGGEPFLFYPVLVKGVETARKMGFEVGIVSNAFWATDREDATSWLEPLARLGIADLSMSTDEYHGEKEEAENVRRALEAARELGIATGVMEVQGIEFYSCETPKKDDKGELMFRGRAVKELAGKARKKPWRSLSTCPEEPPALGRVHVDAFGNVMFCQGITIGNLWEKPLKNIMADLDHERHPIMGPLIRGGPAQLAKELRVEPGNEYADPCHLCYELRRITRENGKLKDVLTPDQMYGVSENRED
jgi:hypothetical protein